MKVNEVVNLEDLDSFPGEFLAEKFRYFLFDLDTQAPYKKEKPLGENEGVDIHCSPIVITMMVATGTLNHNVEDFSEDELRTFAGEFQLFDKKHKVFVDVDSKGIVFK